jgi:hypothetical protein
MENDHNYDEVQRILSRYMPELASESNQAPVSSETDPETEAYSVDDQPTTQQDVVGYPNVNYQDTEFDTDEMQIQPATVHISRAPETSAGRRSHHKRDLFIGCLVTIAAVAVPAGILQTHRMRQAALSAPVEAENVHPTTTHKEVVKHLHSVPKFETKVKSDTNTTPVAVTATKRHIVIKQHKSPAAKEAVSQTGEESTSTQPTSKIIYVKHTSGTEHKPTTPKPSTKSVSVTKKAPVKHVQKPSVSNSTGGMPIVSADSGGAGL